MFLNSITGHKSQAKAIGIVVKMHKDIIVIKYKEDFQYVYITVEELKSVSAIIAKIKHKDEA